MKVAALNALQQMDSERAAPVLRRVLAKRDAASTCLRRKALFLIAQEDGDSVVDVLLASARSDPDREVREQAVFWLSQTGDERAVAALDSILRVSTEPDIQEKAVFALSQQGSARAQQALRAYADRTDVPEEMRDKAIFWLGQSGRADDAAFLRSLYGRLKSPDLKKKVLFSLAQTGTKENQRWLLDVARNTAEPLAQRKEALFWASEGGAPTSDVAAVYATSNERELREQVLFVLSQRGDRAAADQLLEIAKRDPDPELRKKALFWLGQMDDPRAAEVLQEIIEH
jgi:HEAT repeat protein